MNHEEEWTLIHKHLENIVFYFLEYQENYFQDPRVQKCYKYLYIFTYDCKNYEPSYWIIFILKTSSGTQPRDWNEKQRPAKSDPIYPFRCY